MLHPEHMDVGSRNARLYATLKRMGLYVSPIFEADDPTKINRIVVSAELPFAQVVAERAAEARVRAAQQRSSIPEVIGTAECLGENVVRMPTKR
jgi:hypothetical protein